MNKIKNHSVISSTFFITEVRKYQSESRTFIVIDEPNNIYFPATRNEQIIIETDAGTIFTHKLEDGRIPGLKKWYDIHPNLKYKDKIKATVLENNKRYKVETM